MSDLSHESPATVDTLIARYLKSTDRGTTPDREEFIQAHPEHERALRRYFENLALFEELVRADEDRNGATPPTHEPDPQLPEEFGHYIVERVLGRGAMGTVYAARDTRLDRQVALKVPRPGAAPAEVRRRFFREARSAARLHHPNICPVYEVGEFGGRQYISMALIRGHTLRDFATSDNEQPERHVALLIRKLALAIAEAHRQGILHRDLKSANVMVDKDGEPIVMDFGLASLVEDEADVTQSGAIVGTPAYMAPEQVESDPTRIGPETDIYGLGVILYELLTGRLPFQGRLHAVLQQILTDDPPPPSRFRDGLDPSLEAVCLKMLARRPEDRYESMDAVAEELRRFLADEPTLARPVVRIESARKWLKRHPTLTALICVFTVGLPIAFAVAGWVLDKRSAAIVAEREVARSHYRRALNESAQCVVEQVLLRLAAALEPAVASGDHELESSIRRQLGAWQRAVPTQRRSFPQGGNVFALAVSRDGQLVIAGGNDGVPGEKDGTARLWNANTGQPVGLPLVHQDTVFGVDISPDGSRVVTGSAYGTAQVWDTGSGRPVGAAMTHEDRVLTVAFSPDGFAVLTGSDDTTARLWKAETGEPLGLPPLQHGATVRCVDFNPDGRSVLTAGDDGRVCFWSVDSGELTGEILAHSDIVFAARFSPDGRFVLTGSDDGTAQLWDAESGNRAGPLLRLHSRVSSVAFHPDGRTFATTTLAGTARLWETESGHPLAQIQHDEKLAAIAYCPDGYSILTGGWDGQVRSWDVTRRLLTLEHPLQVRAAAYSEDGSTIYTVSGYGEVYQWDAETGEPVEEDPVVHHEIWHRITILSPDGTTLLAGGAEDVLQVSGTDSPRPVMRRFDVSLEQTANILGACFSPDGRTVLTGHRDGAARLWDVDSGRLVMALEHAAPVKAVAFSSDGRRIVTGSWDGTAQFWDVTTGAPIGKPLQHAEGVIAAAFSPDGRWIATATDHDHTVHLWDAATGEPHGQAMRHAQRIRTIVFSPDSSTIVSSCDNHTVQMWNLADFRPLGTPLQMPDFVSTAVFSPDGRTLLIGCRDGGAHLFRITPPVDGSPQQIRTWVEVITGSELDEQGAVRFLDPETRADRRRELERLGGPPSH